MVGEVLLARVSWEKRMMMHGLVKFVRDVILAVGAGTWQ